MSDDLRSLHLAKREELAQSSLLDEAMRSYERVGPSAARGAEEGVTAGERAGGRMPGGARPGGSLAGRLGRDVATGLGIEAPRQIAGGVADAITQVGAMARDFNTWAAENLSPVLGAGVIVDEKGIRLASGEEIAATPTLFDALVPDVDPARTQTGKLVRGVSRFLAGFVGAGKLGPVKVLAGSGKAGAAAAPFVKGALSDFAVFGPHEERLSNLVQKFPALQNPVTEYLSADPADTAMEGRFKNALEGLGLGALTEGLFRVAKVARSEIGARMAAPAEETAEDAASVAARVIGESETQRQRLVELLGDPAENVVSIRKGALSGDRPPADLAEKLAQGADDGREVYINWSRIDSPDDVKSVMQKMADTFGGEVKKAQRGVRSWEQTKLSAEQQDAWRLIADRRTGEAFNAEQATAARELWVRSATKLQSLARIVSNGDKSDAAKIAFAKQLDVHRVVQQEVIGARTETARALNAWKIPVTGGAEGAVGLEQMRTLLDMGGSTKKLADALVRLGERGRLAEAESLVMPTLRTKSADAVRQLYYASILSNPMTHLRVNVSNGVTLGQTIMTRKGANLLGKVLGRENVPDKEAAAGFFGALQGFRDALRISSDGLDLLRDAGERALRGDLAGARAVFGGSAEEFGTFYRSLATGETGILRGAIELPKQGAFDPGVWGLDRGSVLGRVFDWIDTATTVQGRSLGASDEVFGGAAFRAEINMRAFRQATRELEAGEIAADAFATRVSALVSEPDEVSKLAANVLAEQHAMRAMPNPQSSAWKVLSSISRFPVVGKLVMPFPRTAYNVGHFQFQYTPLAPLVESWRKDIAKGGADADIAVTKMLMGTMLLATFTDLAMEGKIIGSGGGDPKLRASREAQDLQAQSVRIGDQTFSIRGFGPLSELAGLAANFADIARTVDWEDEDKDFSDLFLASALAVGQQVLTAQFMRGAADMVNALSDPNRGERWIQGMSSALVPGAVGYVARTSDPMMREALTLSDSLRRKYQSDALPPARDRWGRIRTYASGYGTFVDAVNPFYAKEARTEPIDAELDRLETGVTKPSKVTSIAGVKIDFRSFPPAVYSRYVEISGQAALTDLNAIVTGKHPQSRTYQRGTDGPEGTKAMMIENVVNAHRAMARVQLMHEFPEVRIRVEEGTQRIREQRTPAPARGGFLQ